jgi:glycosyltransferase involved in cell wall biosynthesis
MWPSTLLRTTRSKSSVDRRGREEAAQLQQLTVDLSLDHRVRFWGQQRNVEPFMRAADCFVCPSLWQRRRNWSFSRRSRAGYRYRERSRGIPEYVEDGRNGFLCRPGAPGELADRVRRLLDDGETLSAMSRMARSVAVERCAVSTRLVEYLELYRS